MIRGLKVALLATAFAPALATAPAAYAQTAAGASVGEVIVTARKRQESILKVPVVETALPQATLEKYAIQDLYAVANRVPGFVIGTGIVSAGPQVSIRGIGTTANNPTVDQSVSLNIDGLQFSQGMAYFVGLFDVGQVEVLKGPQALFFGKNSPAGVISLRSADPTSTPEVIARAGYEFASNDKVGELILSGPVSDTLKLRLATRYSDQDGWFRNATIASPALGGMTPTNRRISPERSLILRGTALFDPTDAYSARLKVNYSRDKVDNATPAQIAYCPDGTGAAPGVNIPFIAGDDCKLDKNIHTAWFLPSAYPNIRNGGVPFADTRQAFGTLEQNLKVGEGLTLTSVTGGYTMTQHVLYPGGTAEAAVSIGTDNNFNLRDFTQEVRLTSDYAGPTNFTLGAFYERGLQKNFVTLRGDTAIRLPALLQSVTNTIDIRSFSLFGQVRFKPTPELEIAPGVRWTHEKRTHEELNFNPGSGPLGRVNLPDPNLDSNNVSPELTVTYTPSDDLTVFGAFKTGFKSGSFNTIQFTAPGARAAFNPEKVKGGEVGVKGRALDRRLRFNLAGYYYHYTGLQVGANELTNGTIALRTINAASANVKGVDFDVSYAPEGLDGLSLYAAVNYNRARYGSFSNAPCGNGQTLAQGCNQLLNAATGRLTSQDLSGRRLVRAPTWSGNVGFDYDAPIRSGMTVALGANATFSTKYSTALVDLPGFPQKGFAKFNANVALRGANDAWELALIGSNLGNKITTGQCFNSNTQNGVVFGGQTAGGATSGPAGGDEAVCLADRGREVRIRLTVKAMDLLGR
jgi:iron complex outermembrane receptor protein